MSDLLWPLTSGGILVATVLIGIFAVRKMLKDKKSGFPIQDERTQKITGKAATYAFYIGSYFILALMMINIISQELLNAPFLETGYALLVASLVQSLTFLVASWYFGRKGDS